MTGAEEQGENDGGGLACCDGELRTGRIKAREVTDGEIRARCDASELRDALRIRERMRQAFQWARVRGHQDHECARQAKVA
jgi:hypothetical protein